MLSLHALDSDVGLRIDVDQHTPDGLATHEVTIANATARPLRPGRVVLTSDLVVDHLVEHGHQSWSTVRPARPADVRPERASAPRWFRNQMLEDGDLAGRALCADTVLVHSGGILATTWLDGPPVTFVVDPDGRVSVSIDLEDAVLEPGEMRSAARLRSDEGDPGPLLSTWAELTGAAGGARISSAQPLGWCSWYQYFTDVTAADIIANLELAVDHHLGLVQIDDGWQPSIGDWAGTSPRFGSSIGDLADQIRQRGLSAGIWTAPFLAIEGGELAVANPGWLVRNEGGAPRTALHHEGWGGKVFALDLSQPAVVDHLAQQYGALAGLGFDYFKIDFLHAGVVPGARLGDGGPGRTHNFRNALAAIRAAIGDEATLLGCGSPLAPAVGIVDAMRVSEDVAPHWGPGAHFPGWQESSVGTANAIEASLRRAPLHRRWFANDPDCALLRPSDTELTAGERQALIATIAGTGGFTVLSDDLARYGAVEWDLVEALAATQSIVDGPLDLVDPMATRSIEVVGPRHRLVVDLDGRHASVLGSDGSDLLSGGS
jgi:alpha-galactosidase